MPLQIQTKDNLTHIFGSPLYIFFKDDFIRNYNNILTSFRNIYPKYNIAYSYKTNYTPAICKLVKELGGIAEVVSTMEYTLAKKLGYKNKDIVFNGPVKGESLFEHLVEGGVANVDNLEELNSIIDFSKKHTNINIKIALRINLDIGQNYISRFGFDSENHDIDKTFDVISGTNIRIVGLHCHNSRLRDIDSWHKRISKMFSIVDKYFIEPPQFLDFGSGMNSVMEPELAQQFGSSLPTYTEYASVLATAMHEKFGKLPSIKQPWLLSELGTATIAGYMSFLTKVLAIKNIKGKNFAVLDGSDMNIGNICKTKKLPISINSSGTVWEKVDFVGFTCIEKDILYKDYSGKLAVGDIIEFKNVGGYSNVCKPPFISPNGAMIQLDDNGNTKVLKQKELFKDIFQTYIFD